MHLQVPFCVPKGIDSSVCFKCRCKTYLILPFQVLEMLVRLQQACFALPQRCLVLFVVANNSSQCFHFLHCLQTRTSPDVGVVKLLSNQYCTPWKPLTNYSTNRVSNTFCYQTNVCTMACFGLLKASIFTGEGIHNVVDTFLNTVAGCSRRNSTCINWRSEMCILHTYC